MAAYIIVDCEVTDPAAYERYKALAPAAIAQYGGRYLVRGGKTELLEGGPPPNRLVLLEFPDIRCNLTKGVLPTKSSKVLYILKFLLSLAK